MVRKSLLIALGTVVALAFGCEDKPAGEAGAEKEQAGEKEAGAKLGPGQEFTLESGQDSLKEVKAKDKAKWETSDCVSVLHSAGELKDVKNPEAQKFVEEALQFCGHDVQLAVAEQGAEKIRAIRKEKPDEKFMSECTEVSTALENLDQYGHGDEKKVKEIKELYKKACE